MTLVFWSERKKIFLKEKVEFVDQSQVISENDLLIPDLANVS